MPKTVSTRNYRAATQMAQVIISALYFVAGLIVGFSLRGMDRPGGFFIAGLCGAILLCNAVIWLFRKISLPKVQAQLDSAIAAQDGPGFARNIIRREMTRLIQPVGGLALTIGTLVAVIALREWR
jgi:hypothetical protein